MSFHHAAVTKGLMIGCAATSIAASVFDVKHLLHLQLVPHISRHHQYWRLLIHHFAFSNSSDLLLAELLLYNVSVPIERMFGSAKFASFVAVSTLASSVLEFCALLLFSRFGLNVLPSGPFGVIFSTLYQFSRLVPLAYSFRIFGATMTNKYFVYVLALQLAISQPPGSIALCLTGILTGQRFASQYLLPLIGSTKPPRRSNRALPEDSSGTGQPALSQENTEVITTARAPPATTANDQGGANSSAIPGQSVMREWVDELTGRTDRAASGLRVPPETEISQLTSMFPDLRREDVVGALQRSPNIEAAVDTLLSTQN